MIPTFVVMPVEYGQRAAMTQNLVAQLASIRPPLSRIDQTDLTITRKWNAGLDWAAGLAGRHAHNVAILNNDVEVPPGFLERLAVSLRQREDNWIAYPNVYGNGLPDGWTAEVFNPELAGQTMTGWAFMLRGEVDLRFDEQFEWWYADSDLEKQVRAAGKRVVSVGGCYARHLEPLRSTKRPELLAAARRDEARFAAKWGIDPGSLWLALHPDFGKYVLHHVLNFVY